jgi:protein-S-isoprenylcysteine O-methyltransferase Ste14
MKGDGLEFDAGVKRSSTNPTSSLSHQLRRSEKSSKRADSTAENKQLHDQHEVPLLLKIRQILGIPFYIGVILWTFFPSLMAWAALPLPVWLRWFGVALAGVAILLNAWSHRTLSQKLGRDFNPALRLLKVPALVTEGPYAIIRHPIYFAFLLMQIAVLLLTSNWLIGLSGIGIITAVIIIRVPEEENLLIDQFGPHYRGYTTETGRLLPKFR